MACSWTRSAVRPWKSASPGSNIRPIWNWRPVLQKSYATSQLKPGPYYNHVISTLDRNLLAPCDYQDFSSKVRATIYDIKCLVRNPKTGQWKRPRPVDKTGATYLEYYTEPGIPLFPSETHGFLYYYEPPMAPKIAGEIRFRVTPNSDPASFANGVDLISRQGVVWSIPLLSMRLLSEFGRYAAFRRCLLRSQLVTESLMDHAKKLIALSTAESHRGNWNGTVTASRLHSFGQPFLWDLHVASHLHFIGSDAIRTWKLFCPLIDKPKNAKGRVEYHPLYKGRVLCCFERSTLPEHANTRTVVIRILKFIEPPERVAQDSRTSSVLVEGHLLQRGRNGPPAVVAYDVDAKSRPGVHRCLQILFDNEEKVRQGAQAYTRA